MSARTRTPGVFDKHDGAPPAPRRRPSMPLCDLNEHEAAKSWEPNTLSALAKRVHQTVPRKEPTFEDFSKDSTRANYLHLDAGARHAFWKDGVLFAETAILVPLRRANTELSMLLGVASGYFSLILLGFAVPAGLVLGNMFFEMTALPTATQSAILFDLPMTALGAVGLLGAMVLLGLAFLASSVWLIYQSSRSHHIRIGMHGIRFDDIAITYDEILAVRPHNTRIVFDLLDGSRFETPAGMLDALVAHSVAGQIQSRLPSEDERAAGFVAYERARKAFGTLA